MSNQRGFVLISSMLLIMVLEVFSLALFSRSYIFGQATERNQNKILAFSAAEAALDNAIAQLKQNQNYAGAAYATLNSGGNRVGYEVTVCPPTCSVKNGITLTAPVNPLVRMVLTEGYSPDNVTTSRGYELRQVVSYLQFDNTPFEFAAFADTSLTLNGTPLVDSYNSALGNYGGANVGNDGDIASDGNITLIGNPVVRGDMVSTPGIECVPTSSSVMSQGTLNLAGNTVHTLAAGTYRFDSISISGNASLNLLGPVTIYVDGDVSVAGNGVATSENKPSNLILYGTGTNTISIGGNGAFYGAIYAPKANVSYAGNGDYYGAVIANNYTQSGTYDLHYDTALKDLQAPCTDVNMLSWREANTTAGS